LIGRITLLPDLLGDVIIPLAVFRELQAERTPAIVREFILAMPSWMSVRTAMLISDLDDYRIDTGEREAILLAEEILADALLIDDLAGREAAQDRGLFVIGTVGVLKRATEKRMIDFVAELQKLKSVGFRLSAELEKDFVRSLENNSENA
jgi:predicted nucleic acid-binding protein